MADFTERLKCVNFPAVTFLLAGIAFADWQVLWVQPDRALFFMCFALFMVSAFLPRKNVVLNRLVLGFTSMGVFLLATTESSAQIFDIPAAILIGVGIGCYFIDVIRHSSNCKNPDVTTGL